MKKWIIFMIALLLVSCQSSGITTVEEVKEFIREQGEEKLTDDRLNHLEKIPYTSGIEGYGYKLEDGIFYLSFMEDAPYYGYIEYPDGSTEILIDHRNDDSQKTDTIKDIASLKNFVHTQEEKEIFHHHFSHLPAYSESTEIWAIRYELEDGDVLVSAPTEDEEVFSIIIIDPDGHEEILFNHNIPDESDQRG